MNRFTRTWLAPLLLAFTLAPAAVNAEAPADYVAMSVPDMSQAVGFFEDALDCAPLAGSDANDPRIVLLDCGHGRIVELSRRVGAAAAVKPLSLNTDDIASAARWLLSRKIRIDTHPLGVRSQGSGLLAVDFSTPWGQPLQLVGYAPDDAIQRAASAAHLASD